MELCPGCNQMRPNVGPWRSKRSDHTRLCGGCKVRETLADPRVREDLARDLRQAFASALDAAYDEGWDDAQASTRRGQS